MTIEPIEFVRKPVYVKAVRVTEENFEEAAKWCDGTIINSSITETKHYIKVRVHNPLNTKQTQAYVGDWVLYGDKGYKVYTDKSMQKQFENYEPIDSVVVEAVTALDPDLEIYPRGIDKSDYNKTDDAWVGSNKVPRLKAEMAGLEQVRDQD